MSQQNLQNQSKPIYQSRFSLVQTECDISNTKYEFAFSNKILMKSGDSSPSVHTCREAIIFQPKLLCAENSSG